MIALVDRDVLLDLGFPRETITRNIADFRRSPIPAVTPAEFLRRARVEAGRRGQSAGHSGSPRLRQLSSRRPLNSREVVTDLFWVTLGPVVGVPYLAFDAARE